MIQKLKPFSVRMISSFNHLSGAHVSIKSISDSLTVHLLSTYYRAQYNMPFEYPDLKSIQQHYHHTFEITHLIQKLKPFSVRMISSFNHLSGAHVSIKSISDSLTVHLLSTYYRAQYNMPFEYPDLKSIQQHYHHTFEITRKVVVPFVGMTT
ncbi:hypothetical protein WP50_04040 [Lactiplantibacillus plantarum]|nr:hypothetical protein WP50_04040 [Lactiplantibacillus plantarum]